MIITEKQFRQQLEKVANLIKINNELLKACKEVKQLLLEKFNSGHIDSEELDILDKVIAKTKDI